MRTAWDFLAVWAVIATVAGFVFGHAPLGALVGLIAAVCYWMAVGYPRRNKQEESK